MSQTAIFGPFLAMLGLALLVWIYLYARRIPTGQVGAAYIAAGWIFVAFRVLALGFMGFRAALGHFGA